MEDDNDLRKRHEEILLLKIVMITKIILLGSYLHCEKEDAYKEIRMWIVALNQDAQIFLLFSFALISSVSSEYAL